MKFLYSLSLDLVNLDLTIFTFDVAELWDFNYSEIYIF